MNPLAGDLAFAFQPRTDRAIAALNTQALYPLDDQNVPGARGPGYPFTPMMRTYPGDLVRVKTQAGSTEHEHNQTIHGVKWLQGGSGHGMAKNSGWRNAQNGGISEQFTFRSPIPAAVKQIKGPNDHLWAADASQDGNWTGVWGILRVYDDIATAPLQELVPGRNKAPIVANRADFVGFCPLDKALSTKTNLVPKNRRPYDVVAMLANELLCTRDLTTGNCTGNPLGVTIPANANRNSDGDTIGDNEGAPLNPLGGTLVYNPRFFVI